MSKAKLIVSGGKYVGTKMKDVLKKIRHRQSAARSKKNAEKIGLGTKSIKRYQNVASSGSGDKSAIVPVRAQTKKGSSFKRHTLRGKGKSQYQVNRQGTEGSYESWRSDMERLTTMPTQTQIERMLFKKRKKRGGLSKFDKGGYSEADFPKTYKSGEKSKKPSLAEQEGDTQDYNYGGFDKSLDIVEIPTFKRGGDNMPARNKKNFRPTEKGAGMTKAGVAAYRRANPGSKLQTAVTGKVKPGSKAAKRRKSYCARSLGQLKRASAKTRNDPNSRIRQARRRWKC